jgi:undecaprenyl diphosphate synthase
MPGQTARRRADLQKLGINPDNVPGHVAIIMDGNGRWAQERGLSRIMGHREAVKAVRAAVRTCNELGVKFLTLFAFSVDNWKRPRGEVDSLMDLLYDFLRKERRNLVKNKIRFLVIGDTGLLQERVQKEIAKTLDTTKRFSQHNFVLALNYGGRDDILHAARECAQRCASGKLKPADISEELFSESLYTKGIPDPDLLIRTSGENRISNFLLWQISYTEIWITPTLWPDFRREHLIEAVVDYSRRDRRFGGIGGS